MLVSLNRTATTNNLLLHAESITASSLKGTGKLLENLADFLIQIKAKYGQRSSRKLDLTISDVLVETADDPTKKYRCY